MGRSRASPRDLYAEICHNGRGFSGWFCLQFLKASPRWCGFAPAVAGPSCGSSWILFAMFSTLTESAASCPSSPSSHSASTSARMPAPAAQQPILRTLGPRSMWFLFQVQRHLVRGQATEVWVFVPWCISLKRLSFSSLLCIFKF